MANKQMILNSDPERIREAASGKQLIPEPGIREDAPRDYHMQIMRDGTWLHEGAPINRPALVKLFARTLCRTDDGRYWLATPFEHGEIAVEDTPFLAVSLTYVAGRDAGGRGDLIRFRTNLGAEVECGVDHPLRVDTDPRSGEPRPSILVRDRLSARLTRATFYELVDLVREREQGGEKVLGIWSKGAFFALGPAVPEC